MPSLIICQDGQDYHVIDFSETITLGRESKNDVVLPSPQVSRHHATIRRMEDGSFELLDNESTNGVWLGGREISQQLLCHGDSFTIGDYFLTFLATVAESQKVFSGSEHSLVMDDDNAKTVLFSLAELRQRDSPKNESGEGDEVIHKLSCALDAIKKWQTIADEDELLQTMLANAINCYGAKRGFVALMDRKNELVYRAVKDFDIKGDHGSVLHDLIKQGLERQCAILSQGSGGKGKSGKAGLLVFCMPLLQSGRSIGCIYLERDDGLALQAPERLILEMLALTGASFLNTVRSSMMLQAEREEMKTRLAVKDRTIIRSEKMLRLFEDIRTIAPINVPVLIFGEPGCGKELVASALHKFSGRKGGYITLNCSAIPDGIFESELFGSVKGAYHEAVNKPGKLEMAHNGTIFLDEVGDMQLPLQPKLLRFLENGEITRLGDTQVKKLDTRVVAATNRDLPTMISEKQFRDDLYQRLACFTLRVPPLRDRQDDIEPLVLYFLEKFAAEYNWSTPTIADNVLVVLTAYQWPGNVRELRNTVLRLAVHSRGKKITMSQLAMVGEQFQQGNDSQSFEPFPTLEEMEKQQIEAALHRARWNVSDAAKMLGIARSTFYQKIKKYGITVQSR